jgi:predicted acyltransferase
MLLIALTFYIVDVRGWGKGLNWLKIYGMNAITAYMIGMVIKFTSVSESLLHGFSSLECYPVMIELANVSILFGILYILYRNRIFLKV